MKHIIAILTTFLFSVLSFGQTKWVNADNFPVYGKCVQETSARYERLTPDMENVSRPGVWWLGRNSAGLYVRFRSNSSIISARWTSTFNNSMDHMADVGTKGLDLYILDGKQWKFVGSGRPGTEQTRTSTMIANMDPVEREFMIYLSLYDGVQSLEIGIDEDATIQAPGIESPKADSPVVMYGSSILQGGCCSRPGMAFTNILSRRFDREVINLGFSGNALLDYDIAELIAKVENPSLFVLDYVPNASAEQIREKGEKFFRIIRDAHPDVPVIFIDDPFYAHYGSDMKMTAEIDGKNEAQAELVAKLKKQGEKNIQYIQLQHTLGTDNEPFVDGVHYTDLGMMRYADFLTPYFKRALK